MRYHEVISRCNHCGHYQFTQTKLPISATIDAAKRRVLSALLRHGNQSLVELRSRVCLVNSILYPAIMKLAPEVKVVEKVGYSKSALWICLEQNFQTRPLEHPELKDMRPVDLLVYRDTIDRRA